MLVPTLDGDAPTPAAVARCLDEALPLAEQHDDKLMRLFNADAARLGYVSLDQTARELEASCCEKTNMQAPDTLPSSSSSPPLPSKEGTDAADEGQGGSADVNLNSQAVQSLAGEAGFSGNASLQARVHEMENPACPVFVHCRCGMGRSATVATSILLWMHACDRFGLALPRAASSAFVATKYVETAVWYSKFGARTPAPLAGDSPSTTVGIMHGTAKRDSVLRQVRRETKRVIDTIRRARPEVLASVGGNSAVRALEHYIVDLMLASSQ